jgi:hypothetical protein
MITRHARRTRKKGGHVDMAALISSIRNIKRYLCRYCGTVILSAGIGLPMRRSQFVLHQHYGAANQFFIAPAEKKNSGRDSSSLHVINISLCSSHPLSWLHYFNLISIFLDNIGASLKI